MFELFSSQLYLRAISSFFHYSYSSSYLILIIPLVIFTLSNYILTLPLSVTPILILILTSILPLPIFFSVIIPLTLFVLTQLSPSDFVQMTAELFGESPQPERELPVEPVVVKKEAVHLNTRKKVRVVAGGTVKGGRKETTAGAARAAAAAAATALRELEEKKAEVEAEAAAALAAIAAEEARTLYNITRKQRSTYVTRPVWRMALFGASGTRGFGMSSDEEIQEKERLERKRVKKEKRREEIAADERFFNGEDSDED